MPVHKAVGASIRSGITGVPALARRHRLFSASLVLAAVPRAIAMLGYQPAILFKLDTYDYLWDAAHLQPNVVNPNGYSLFLWLLKPAHSLALVAGIQHMLGLASAVAVYAIMRRFGAPAWVGTLAAVTLLFDPATFLSEQLIMADLLAMVLMIMAFAVLLLRDEPSVPRVAVAGLLLGASAVVRPTTLPLIVFFGAYLLLRRAGWRQVLSVLAGGVLPVAAYLCWFAAAHGSFNLSNSNGLFLWSRTMSFANCSVIKPPADLVALCPAEQPRQRVIGAGAPRLLPKVYLWDHNAWMWRGEPSTGVVPDVAAFTPANNQRALRFAVKAIEAQPLSYARAIAKDVATPLISRDVFPFPGPVQPRLTDMAPVNRAYALAAVRAYTGSTAGIGPYLGHPLGTRLVEPYAHLLRGYQKIIFVPGPLFALVVALGLAGIVLPRRRVGAAVLLWVSAVVTIVLPIAEHEYTYRYVIPSLPLACMAAALAVTRRPQAVPAGEQELAPELPQSVSQP